MPSVNARRTSFSTRTATVGMSASSSRLSNGRPLTLLSKVCSRLLKTSPVKTGRGHRVDGYKPHDITSE